jgi:hypothetical protein
MAIDACGRNGLVPKHVTVLALFWLCSGFVLALFWPTFLPRDSVSIFETAGAHQAALAQHMVTLVTPSTDTKAMQVAAAMSGVLLSTAVGADPAVQARVLTSLACVRYLWESPPIRAGRVRYLWEAPSIRTAHVRCRWKSPSIPAVRVRYLWEAPSIRAACPALQMAPRLDDEWYSCTAV